MKKLFFNIIVFVVITLPGISFSQEKFPLKLGKYKGTWTEAGSTYKYSFEIDVSFSEKIDSFFLWTLEATPRSNERSKIGLQGKEFVHGTFNPSTRRLHLNGFKKEDPHVILGLDKYELTVSKDGKTISGKTYSHGSWKGILNAKLHKAKYQNTLKATTAEKKDITPPIIHLQRGIKVEVNARKNIFGQAIDESGVAIVEINGKEAKLDENGYFSTNILLKPGKNNVVITAIDIHENQATKTIIIERNSKPVIVNPVAETIKTGRYYALLIAVQDYQSPSINDLDQPLKDAYKVKRSLQNYTFDPNNTILLKNPTREQIIETFDNLSRQITKMDNLLIFYAGHGYWDERFKQGYWLPSNASKNSKSKWLSNSTIRDYIRGIQSKHTLLVADACFSGGIFKTRSAFDNAPPATNELYRLPSRKAMTSGTLMEVPDKSVFVEFFTRRLQESNGKYLSSEQLFASFKNAVINNSPLKQIPQYGEIREAGDEGGDFIFIRR